MVGLLEVALFDFLDKSRDVDADRAAFNALGLFAAQASGGLFHGFFFIVT
jgi:hypothetical protein